VYSPYATARAFATAIIAAWLKARRDAIEMVKAVPAALAAAKPALVVWGIGTVDAVQAINPDHFSQVLNKGINIARSAGADVVFINPQYGPRTESMIALGTYTEDMRWVALRQEVPLFDRFSIMKLWADVARSICTRPRMHLTWQSVCLIA
jgi:hypothetical protein